MNDFNKKNLVIFGEYLQML